MPLSPIAGINWFPVVSSEAATDTELPGEVSKESLEAEEKHVESPEFRWRQNEPHPHYTSTYTLPKTRYGFPAEQEMLENNDFGEEDFEIDDSEVPWWVIMFREEERKQRAFRIATREAWAMASTTKRPRFFSIPDDPLGPSLNHAILPENIPYAEEYRRKRAAREHVGQSVHSSQSSLPRLVSTEYEVRDEVKQEVKERIAYFTKKVEEAKRRSLEGGEEGETTTQPAPPPSPSPQSKHILSPKRWLNRFFGKLE